MKTDELKEGDEVELRGKVVEIEDFDLSFSRVVHLEVETSNGKKRVPIMEDACHLLRKVRPDTYEVTARDIVDVFNAIADEDWDELLLEAYMNGEIAEQNIEEMERIIDTHLKELKRKRKR